MPIFAESSGAGPESQTMTARQGKIAVAATVVGMTALLLRNALVAGGWVGFAVTEVQILTAMAVSWWVLSGR
jgi:hypothetical protein